LGFKFFNSYEFKDFKVWCENHNKDETKLLKKYMRLTIIHDIDLDSLISDYIKQIKNRYGNLPPVYPKKVTF